MEYSLVIILFYGILHALGPDHLSAIALFSIGKNKRETLTLSLLFAFGHGLMLYLMAILIRYFANDSLLAYGDSISAVVILLMGLYLVYLAFTDKIKIDNHQHQHDEKHTHIYYKNVHLHDKSVLFSLGLLMGVGGIRGMLVTLSAVSHESVGFEMIFAFILGVSIVFLCFGYLIYLINERLSVSMNSLRYAIFSVGFLSILIGSYNLSEVYLIG
ncbi:Nickel and cobalt efflux transporter rcnA [hydrothermal vent metagenome]|uniref:Nickel and cobalt efflux transporter rcnA n=1 Tax=hydrothermal vent metagenome TaxID=652676 RepID=A0A1W1CWK9_9ZZZZ